ncbi:MULTISPECIES: RNA polymerase subunit sigma [unclassified Shewanella]|uniref:RNA polymerase subunit sigma n=1 Tax=unclassified Shewanella TaxID=196818 RepID=UPI0009708211|nr:MULTISPECIES: RNA polymerase subunit sigma [unclassified Shewanella]MDO6618018.1 glycine zipper family protein [Shewanella sp. 6_MG-2023]MDO6640997.1 glycine zipper family protein [Shewanella sp. 5_MG-2023]MDO6679177.1 glycine zipper family protein [Shewanella sp. 4_MG-2023]MDO6776478.1 glycine zipper family protein [Shewanella sp. 3_MG-2023]PMG30729.1 RNA polymerase subunit sigma [Shewanella sp. 10N.286.52.C2]
MKKLLLVSLSFLAFSASANIIYDKTGVNEKDFVFDQYQCQEMSQQVHKNTESRGAISSGLKGAAVGAAGSAIAGGSGSHGAKTGAGIGVAVGLLGGAKDRRANEANYEAEKETVVRNCMANRGYSILN